MLDFLFDNLKFIFYAFLFVVYLISQVRKVAKKAAETAPVPAKPVAAKGTSTDRKTFDYKGKREPMRKLNPRPRAQKQEDEPVVYKPVADEDLIAESRLVEMTLAERKKEEEAMKKDRVGLADEHLDPYVDQRRTANNTANWLKNKANLRTAFIASEIFQRKY